jgi:hypothetical protein
MSRRGDRQGEPTDTRVRLLEDDLDRAEENIVTAKRELNDQISHTKNTARTLVESVKVDLTTRFITLEADVRAGFAECEQRDNQTRKLLTGLLVSIVTLCVTVTVGVLVALGGG